MSALRADLRDNGVEWVQLAVPSLLYTVQNVMLFVGAAHLEASIAQVRERPAPVGSRPDLISVLSDASALKRPPPQI